MSNVAVHSMNVAHDRGIRVGIAKILSVPQPRISVFEMQKPVVHALLPQRPFTLRCAAWLVIEETICGDGFPDVLGSLVQFRVCHLKAGNRMQHAITIKHAVRHDVINPRPLPVVKQGFLAVLLR